MPSITTEVDIYVSPEDFSDDELITEVGHRLSDYRRSKKKSFKEKLDRELSGQKPATSLLDQVKTEIFNQNMHKKSIDEIEQFFS